MFCLFFNDTSASMKWTINFFENENQSLATNTQWPSFKALKKCGPIICNSLNDKEH